MLGEDFQTGVKIRSEEKGGGVGESGFRRRRQPPTGRTAGQVAVVSSVAKIKKEQD